MLSKKLSTLLSCLLALAILTSSHGHATEASPESVHTKDAQELQTQGQNDNQEVAKILTSIGWNGTKTVSLIALSELIGPVIHEFGHYLTLKAIDPSMQNSIHLFITEDMVKKIGAQTSLDYHKNLFKNDPRKLALLSTIEQNQILGPKPDPMFTIGPASFYGSGPISINSPMQKEIATLSPTKKIAFFTAGGMSKLIFSYFLLTMLAAQKKYQETEDTKEALVFGLQHALTPFENISSTKNLTPVQLIFETIWAALLMFFTLDELFYTFTPISYASFSNLGSTLTDGDLVWKTLLGYGENRPLNGDQAFTFNSIKFVFGILYLATLVVLVHKSVATILRYKKDGQEEQESQELGGPELEEIEAAIQEALQNAP